MYCPYIFIENFFPTGYTKPILLPREVYFKILSFLPLIKNQAHLALTCKSAHNAFKARMNYFLTQHPLYEWSGKMHYEQMLLNIAQSNLSKLAELYNNNSFYQAKNLHNFNSFLLTQRPSIHFHPDYPHPVQPRLDNALCLALERADLFGLLV